MKLEQINEGIQARTQRRGLMQNKHPFELVADAIIVFAYQTWKSYKNNDPLSLEEQYGPGALTDFKLYAQQALSGEELGEAIDLLAHLEQDKLEPFIRRKLKYV